MRRHCCILFLVLSVTVAVAACTRSDNPGPEETGANCVQPALERDSAFPGDAIAVTGLPPGLTGISAEVSTAAVEDVTSAMVISNEDGSHTLIAPLHPNGIAGGELSLTVTDGQLSCPELSLTIRPLPEAPGAFAAYSTAYGSWLAAWREEAGATREQLLQEEIPPQLVPLALTQYLYDGSDSPLTLSRVANGDATAAGGEAVDMTVLDAMVAHLGLTEQLEETARIALGEHRSVAGVQRLARRAPQQQGYDAWSLSHDMTRQDECLQLLAGKSGDVWNDTELAVLGIGVVAPPAGAALGTALLAAKIPLEACAYTLPSKFTSMDVEVTDSEFLEDYDFQHRGGGQVQAVTVSGESEGWNITGVLVDVILTMTGPVGNAADKFGLNQVTTDAIQELQDVLAAAANNICGRSECKRDVAINVPPIPFFGVNVFYDEFVELSAVESIAMGDRWGEYLPARVGKGGIRAETSDRFGNAYVAETAEVDVRQIEVTLTPAAVTLHPGQEVAFDATILFAEQPELNEWRLVSPQDEVATVAENQSSFTFRAPPIPPDPNNPCKERQEVWGVIVEATTDTGLRANSDERREAAATITVISDPDDPRCVTPTPTATPQPNTCLWGTWVLDNQSYLAFLQAVAPAGSGEFSAINGQMTTTFSEDWQTTMESDLTLVISTAAGAISSDIQHSGSGTYHISEDGQYIYFDGAFLAAVNFAGAGSTAESEGGEVAFTCEGDTLTFHMAAADIEYHRQE